jgi:3-hydroxypropanoate dehydrogenase
MSAADGAVARRIISSEALDQLFREARTYRKWRPGRVPEAVLRELYQLSVLGPTSGNCLPGRFVFIASEEAKERLIPALDRGNVEKTRTAPVTVIVAYDSDFVETMRRFTGNPNAMPWLAENPAAAAETAFRNGTLQGGYLILAARALGLDCGPMSGFNTEMVNREFFPDGKWKANFLCNMGYGDPTDMPPRGLRLAFEDACRIL